MAKKYVEINGQLIDPNKRRKKSIHTWLFIAFFMIGPVFNFALFYVYTNLSSFTLAFQEIVSGETIWTLNQFKDVFAELADTSSGMWEALKNTFLTFIIDLCMYPVTILVSYFLYKKIRGHNVFRLLFFFPQIISSIVWSYFYTNFVSQAGPIAPIVQDLCNLDYVPTLLKDSDFANTFVWINMIWMGFPGSLIIWGGTFSRIPDSIIEYAKLDGVNWVREMVQIILPLVWPTFSLFLIMKLAGIFSASGNVFLLTDGGDYGTQTLSNWFYMQVYGVTLRPGTTNVFNYMSAWGMIITVIACTLSFTVRKGLVKLVPDVEF